MEDWEESKKRWTEGQMDGKWKETVEEVNKYRKAAKE